MCAPRASSIRSVWSRERIGSVSQLEQVLRHNQRGWLVLVRRGNRLLRLQLG